MKADKTAAVVLAEGFEETEAITIVDVLRRAGVAVQVASLSGERQATGAHDITVAVDCGIGELDAADLDLLALPGGMPGASNLAASGQVRALIREVHGKGNLVAAICAGPLALRDAGILDGLAMTCYPSFRDEFAASKYEETDVVRHGNVLTGSGPGTALRFSLALVAALGLEDQAGKLRAGMLAL
jgi:4-methyl-5(b-hydroxyethyl)-thiazole monophosphate biosynthesis